MDYIDHLNLSIEQNNYELFQKIAEIYYGTRDYCNYRNFRDLYIIHKEDTRFAEFWLTNGSIREAERWFILTTAIQSRPVLADLVMHTGGTLHLSDKFLKDLMNDMLKQAKLDACEWLIQNGINFERIVISDGKLPKKSIRWIVDRAIKTGLGLKWLRNIGIITTVATYDMIIDKMLELNAHITEADFQMIIQSPIDVGKILMQYPRYTKFFKESLWAVTMRSFTKHGDPAILEERLESFSEDARAVARIYMISPKKSAISP